MVNSQCSKVHVPMHSCAPLRKQPPHKKAILAGMRSKMQSHDSHAATTLTAIPLSQHTQSTLQHTQSVSGLLAGIAHSFYTPLLSHTKQATTQDPAKLVTAVTGSPEQQLERKSSQVFTKQSCIAVYHTPKSHAHTACTLGMHACLQSYLMYIQLPLHGQRAGTQKQLILGHSLC
jgi:hypothetical protein